LDYRNIDRTLVLNKALKKFERENFKIKLTELFVLRSVAHGNNSIVSIQEHLKSFYRTYPTNMIADILTRFIDLKLVIKTGFKYDLSFAGEAALKSIEMLVRNTRIDK
jgi:predicted transcriptional regulator